VAVREDNARTRETLLPFGCGSHRHTDEVCSFSAAKVKCTKSILFSQLLACTPAHEEGMPLRGGRNSWGGQASRRPTAHRIRHLEETSFTSSGADGLFRKDRPPRGAQTQPPMDRTIVRCFLSAERRRSLGSATNTFPRDRKSTDRTRFQRTGTRTAVLQLLQQPPGGACTPLLRERTRTDLPREVRSWS